MQRRDLLKALAGLPLVGLVGESPAEAALPSTASPARLEIAEDPRPLWIQRGEQMCRHLLSIYTEQHRDLTGPGFLANEAVCYRFSRHLDDWSLSEPFTQGGAAPNPPLSFEVTAERGLQRELRAVLNMAALDDLRAFHGIDAQAELVDLVAQQAVLEVQMEIRRAIPALSAYRIHALVLQSPVFLAEDFSVRRKTILYYTKT